MDEDEILSFADGESVKKEDNLEIETSSYSVVLRSDSSLPYKDLSEKIAGILGVGDIGLRVKYQQGIVWENLRKDIADELALFLTSKGFPAGLVPQMELPKPGKVTLVHKAEPTDSGIRIYDLYDRAADIDGSTITLAQLGWVEEEVEIGHNGPKLDLGPMGHGYAGFHMGGLFYQFDSHGSEGVYTGPTAKFEKLGWVLHLFCTGSKLDWYRIVGRNFNYGNVGLFEGTWERRFIQFVDMLANSISVENQDAGMKARGEPIDNISCIRYLSLHEMVEHARWNLTVRTVVF
jgi:hypothetical protein